MTLMNNILAGGAGLAAIAMASPVAAQYANPYGYGQNYGYAQSYGYAQNSTQIAAQRCSAAVQNRLSSRTGLRGILGAVLGNQAAGGRVVSITQVSPRRSNVRVRGLASSGANYGPYGVGAYGALAYNYQPDLSFRCDVDYRGYVRSVDIIRRR
jgi:hypothetical protein